MILFAIGWLILSVLTVGVVGLSLTIRTPRGDEILLWLSVSVIVFGCALVAWGLGVWA